MKLQVTGLSWTVDGHQILRGVSLRVEAEQFVGLIGPNGSGKSTLLRCVYRVLRPDAGLVSLDGRSVWELTTRQTARSVAVVLQERSSQFDFTVREVVLMGRSPHKRLLDGETADDDRMASEALAQVGLSAFEHRSFPTLSGGEQQRALVARALVQQPRLLVLDEPTSHLDIHHQIQILDLVRSVKLTSVAALHDLNLAAEYCDWIYVLNAGVVVASGPPDEVLTVEMIRDVYRVRANVSRNPSTGRPHVMFMTGGVC